MSNEYQKPSVEQIFSTRTVNVNIPDDLLKEFINKTFQDAMRDMWYRHVDYDLQRAIRQEIESHAKKIVASVAKEMAFIIESQFAQSRAMFSNMLCAAMAKDADSKAEGAK